MARAAVCQRRLRIAHCRRATIAHVTAERPLGAGLVGRWPARRRPERGSARDRRARACGSCCRGCSRDGSGAVRSLQRRHPRHEPTFVGFSLGGNFALRVGASARSEELDLARIVAVCPVIDPANALSRLDSGSVLYRRYFIGKWRRSLRRKSATWPHRYDFGEMLRMTRLTQMTDHFVRRYTDYPSLDHYLRSYTIGGDTLRGLDVNTWLIAATDDPILPVEDVGRLPPLRQLRITRTRYGGHCGYREGRPGPTWLERSIGRVLSGL